MPDSNVSGQRQHGKDEGQDHRYRLGRDQNPMAVGSIRRRPADRREEKDRDLGGERRHAEQRRRAGEPVHQPRLGDRLHPGAGERNQLSREEELVIAMAEGAKQLSGHGRGPRPCRLRPSVNRARTGPARVAAVAARSGCRRVERLVTAAAGHGEHRQQLLQIGAATGGA